MPLAVMPRRGSAEVEDEPRWLSPRLSTGDELDDDEDEDITETEHIVEPDDEFDEDDFDDDFDEDFEDDSEEIDAPDGNGEGVEGDNGSEGDDEIEDEDL